MNENNFAAKIESLRDRLTIIHCRISQLPETQQEADLLTQVLDELQVAETELAAEEKKHQQTETALRDSEELLRQLAENIREVFFINSADASQMLYISPAYEEIWGYSCDSLYQQPYSWLDAIHPEDQNRAMAALTRKSQGEPIQVDYRIIRPDGSLRWIFVRSFPVYNEAGDVIRHVGIAEDITERKYTEFQIQALVERLLSVIDTVGEGITLSDETGYFEIFNSKMEEITGYTRNEANTSDDFLALLYPDRNDYHNALVGIQQILQEGGCSNLETTICAKDGTYKTLLVSTSSLNEGDTNWFLSAYRDISDVYNELCLRQRAEEELRQSQYLIQRITDSLPQVLYIYDLITSSSVYVNNQVFELLGYTPEFVQQLGCQFLEQTVHPEDLHRIHALSSRFADVSNGEVLETEYRMKHTNGSWRWFRSHDVVFTRSAYGLPEQILGTAQDITDRKRIELALRESEERFRQLAENIQDVFWISDVQTQNVLYISPVYEQIWGFSCESLYANPYQWVDAIYPEDRELVFTNWFRAKQGETVISEYRIVRPNGEIRWICDRAFPIKNEQGEVYRLVGIAEDISDRKLSEDRIRASLREKEVLLKEIHHRVKNNLQIIASLLRLQTNRIENNVARTMLEDSRKRVESMALVHESLYRSGDFSRINFSKYVENLAANLFRTYTIQPNTISFRVSIDDDIFITLAQAIPCGLIINELIGNALKHGFKNCQHGEVFLTLNANLNQQITLTVGNKGDKLPEDFDFQNTQSMGLKLVMTLVKQLKGIIEMENGDTTLFKVKFTLLD